MDATSPEGKKCLHKIGRALVELEKSYKNVFEKKPFLNNFTDLSVSDCLRLKKTFEEVNSKNGEVGAYRCQELADLITQRGHLIEKGVNISDLYDFTKKSYDKKIEGFIFDMTLENIGEMGGDIVGNLGLASAIAIPFRDIVGTFVGRFCGALISYSLVAGAVFMTPGKLPRKVTAAVLGAFALGTLTYLEMNPVMALSILGAEALAENLVHFSMTLMTAYVGMKMMGTGESFEDYVRNMIFASSASKGVENFFLIRGNEGFLAQTILPYIVAHFVYNLPSYDSAFHGTLLQENQGLLNQSIQDFCEKSAINKAIKEGLNRSTLILGDLIKKTLPRLDLRMVEALLQIELESIRAPLVSIGYKWIEKQNLIPSGILSKNTLDISKLLSAPIGHGIFIQKFNQFYERKVKGELKPLFETFHKRLTHLQEETTVEMLVHPERLPTIEKDRADIIERVIQGKIPKILPYLEKACSKTLLKRLDSQLSINGFIGNITNFISLGKLPLQARRGEEILDIMLKAFIVELVFTGIHQKVANQPKELERFYSNCLDFIFGFQFSQDESVTSKSVRGGINLVINHQVPAFAHGALSG